MKLQFRKKPVTITATIWNGTAERADFIRAWSKFKVSAELESGRLFIDTLEGQMTAQIGDYIICGVKGEFYPCKPDIFEATYESAND